MASIFENIYKPDVLSCLADLSNDEVFTPPEVANQMLDMLPQNLFSDPNTKFLDPSCKSGVFLREIAKRLIDGLEDQIPNLQERLDHIFHNQLYGIAITELTSLLSRRSVYCSKYPNGPFSVSAFENIEGNIRYRQVQHTWVNGKCKFCGTSQTGDIGEEGREGLETHAYEWIHIDDPEELANMKFDVIISNPPYQLDDGGHGASAKPIYQLFVDRAKRLNPRYLTMIIPARWYAGGKGLDSFRKEMLNDRHISKLVDFGNSRDVFAGVDIAGGVCYFLWDRDYEGACEIKSSFGKDLDMSQRFLNEFDILIRNSKAVSIVKKVMAWNEGGEYLSESVSPRKPFGLPTNYEPQNSGVPCWFVQRIGKKYANARDVSDPLNLLGKYKYLAPPAPIAGQTDFTKPVGFFYDGNTRIAAPGECCTESYIVLGAFDSLQETEFFKSYILTKVVRFLLLQTVVSQHVTQKNYMFIPALPHYDREYTDDYLCELWGITPEERKHIETRIGEIGINDA